ncbi:MAG: hypothetical protein RDV48_17790 [Candidatus Eremiobacteraeota bacterium]|nr:hypothetical protein [Candidatus Eremiobacteraeota bacterium]
MGSLFGKGKGGTGLTPSQKEASASLQKAEGQISRVLSKGFSGEHSETDVQHQLRKWIDNSRVSLDTVTRSLKAGKDRRGGPLNFPKISEGLCKMCDDYCNSPYMVKLERSMGASMRDEFRNAILLVQEAAKKLAG